VYTGVGVVTNVFLDFFVLLVEQSLRMMVPINTAPYIWLKMKIEEVLIRRELMNALIR
jgi:hypothetical protein